MNPAPHAPVPSLTSSRIRLGAFLALLLTAFHLLTISSGHIWYSCDFALYLQHAKNILEGAPYARSGYLVNPHLIISPPAYPPILPLLLAPIYGLFGLDFWMFKAEIVLFFGAMLFISFLWAGRQLKSPFLYLYPLLLGLNPSLWEKKNSIYSDLPFLFFLFLTILVVEWRDRVPAEKGNRWWVWAVTGILIYISFGTRTVGIVLAPALLVHDLIRHRRLTFFSVAASLLALGAVIVQGLIIGSQGSGVTGYMAQLQALGAHNFHNLFLALKNLGRLTFGQTPSWWSYPLFACTLATALLGLITQLKKEIGFIHIMTVFYLGVLFLFPHQPTRYLFVILPLFLLWFLLGLQALGSLSGRKTARAAAAFLVLAVFLSYGMKYQALLTAPPLPKVTDPAALEVYRYLEHETGESSRIMFSNPRVISFFTGRVSSVWHCDPKEEGLLPYMYRIRATHLVLPLWKRECVERLIRDHPDIFREKMANNMFKVYLIDRSVLEREKD